MSVFEQYTIYQFYSKMSGNYLLWYVGWNCCSAVQLHEIRISSLKLELRSFVPSSDKLVECSECVLQLHFWERRDFVVLLALVTNSSGLLRPLSESPSPALRFNFSKIIFSCCCVSLIEFLIRSLCSFVFNQIMYGKWHLRNQIHSCPFSSAFITSLNCYNFCKREKTNSRWINGEEKKKSHK